MSKEICYENLETEQFLRMVMVAQAAYEAFWRGDPRVRLYRTGEKGSNRGFVYWAQDHFSAGCTQHVMHSEVVIQSWNWGAVSV